jgi:hypothetical protein
LDELTRQGNASPGIVDRVEPAGGHGGDGDNAAVVEPLAVGGEGAVDQDAVAGGVAALAVSPGGPGQLGAVDLAGRPEPAADPVGDVFAVGVGDREGGDAGGSVGGDVSNDGGGEGFAGGVRGAEIVLPAVSAADCLAGGHEAGPVDGEGVAFGGVELAAVLGQVRGGDVPVGAEAGEFGAEPAGSYRLGLVRVTQAPQGCFWCDGHGGEHDLGVGGGDLGHLVEDDHRPGWEGGAVEGEAGDGHGRDAGVAEFSGGLVGGGQADHPIPGGRGSDGGGVDGGGLPESGGGDQAADGRARGAQRPDGVGLVGAEARCLIPDGAFGDGPVDPGDGGDGEVAEVVQDPPFEEEMIEGGVLRGAPAGGIDQGDGVVGVEEARREVLDGLDVEAPRAEGGDLLDHVGLVEPGPVGAEPFLGVDEGPGDVAPFQAGPEFGDGPVADVGLEGMAGGESDLVRLGLPPLAENLGGEGAVFAGAGSE